MTNLPVYQPTPFRRIGAVELVVSDLSRSLSFYQDIIGFQVFERTEKKIVLTADGKQALFILKEDKQAPARPRKTTGLYHLALLLPTRQDLGRFLSFLLKKHLPVDGASDHSYSEAVYLSDPDGNGIEVYTDRPPATWKRDINGDYMATIDRLNIDNLLAEAGNKTWDKLPKGTTTGHIHLSVSDLAEAEHFYGDIMGLDVVTRFREQALFLSKDHYHHQIAVNIWNGSGIPHAPINSVGLRAFTLHMTEDEQHILKQQCEKYGYPYQKEEDGLCLSDPYGHVIYIRTSL